MKNRNDGRFLVWFCDMVYALSNLFGAHIEDELFAERLPEIAARVHEIRDARPNVRKAYCKVAGIEACLANVDSALYSAERLISKEPIDEEERGRCWCQLIGCARELAELWTREYNATTMKQQTLYAQN